MQNAALFFPNITSVILCDYRIKIQCFFNDYLKNRTKNKTTCKTSSANPHQLCTYYLENFPTCMIIF